METEPSILDSLLARIRGMGNSSAITSQQETVDDRALVVYQPPVDMTEGLPDVVTTENMNDGSVTEPEDLFTMSGISMQDVAPTMSGEALPDSDDCASECESWIQGASEDDQNDPWIPLPFVVNEVVVEVELDGVEKKFIIAEDLLRRNSSYFNTALSGEWIEATSKKFVLDERLDLFEIFHEWLLQGNLEFLKLESWIASSKDVSVALVEIYCFADRRGVQVLGDQVLEKLDKYIRPEGLPVRLDVDIINLAWESLSETTGLCRYILAIERDADRCNMPSRIAGDFEDLNGFFTLALLKLTHKESDPFFSASIDNKLINVAKLHYLVKNATPTSPPVQCWPLAKWGSVCRGLGLESSANFTQSQLNARVRDLYGRLLRHWDVELPQDMRATIEERCPRPMVKKFFQSGTAPATRSAPTRAVAPTAPAVTQ